MGFLDSLFQPGMTTELPNFIERPSQEIGSRIGNILNRPGQRTFNPTEQEGIEGLIGQAQAGNPFLGQSTNFLQNLFQSGGLNDAEFGLGQGLINGEAINPAASETARIAFGGELGQNPFLESQFNRAANVVGENFQQNIVPGLDNEFAASGRSGSLRYAGERNRAEDAYGRQINDLANQVYGGQYNSDLARRDAALGQLGQLGQQDVQNRLSGAGLFQQGIGNVFQGLGQTGAIDEQRFSDAARLLQTGGIIQQRPFVPLQTGANILSGLQGTPTTNTNPLGQLFGLGVQLANSFAGGAGAAAAGGASDARLKRDVTRVGELPSGLPVYRFRYVWGDDPQVGVMAHEALERFPDAVALDPDGGWLTVDYARIG